MSVFLSSKNNRLASVALLTFLLILGTPAAAHAHELKVDGNIAAVMHTDPDDDPVTGSPTKFFIEFEDNTGKFSLSKCTCTVSFIENGATTTTMKLAVTSRLESDGSYTFTHPADYTMRFTGAPSEPGGFQPFVLNYSVRVADGNPISQSTPAALWIGVGAGVGLIMLTAYVTNRGSSSQSA